VKICLRVRKSLRERQWIAGLDQHVEPPGLDLFALRLGLFDRLGHGLRVIRSDLDEPSRRKLEVETESLRSCRELVEAPAELVQAAVEHRALRLRVGSDLAQTVAEARFNLVRAILERHERFVALALECRAQT
jgi:hypothetical protein